MDGETGDEERRHGRRRRRSRSHPEPAPPPPDAAADEAVALKRRRRTSRQKGDPKPAGPSPEWGGLVVFWLMVVLGPLAFGAGDRVVQIALLGLFAVGLLLRPPDVVLLSRRAGTVLLVLTGILVLKEFAPAPLFGGTAWRTTLTESFGQAFPWTHHPEPGKAVDALLTGSIAALWFLWVRTLAGVRENRPLLAAGLFAAAVLVAAASFATQGMDPKAIYGWRFTPGWRGFGPFPNRNHTASFLAMGALVGFGCIAWAGVMRKYRLLAILLALATLPLAALMTTQSRGGLLAFAAGCGLYVLLLVCKLRGRRSLAVITASVLAALALVLAFGAPLFERFSRPDSAMSNASRTEIWKDSLRMWRDAPLFGHGAASFSAVFPMYQQIELDNQVVLHPESSWLKWLTELGLVPMLLGLGAALYCLPAHLREMFARQHGFYLTAAGFAAVAALLVHGAIDVPPHRWGTAGFGLAALALAFPRVKRNDAAASEWDLESARWRKLAGRAGLIPLGIGLFWCLPFIADWPRWSPQSVARLVDRATGLAVVSAEELDAALAVFPLNAKLHQVRGFYELQKARPRDEVWLRHFRLAQRLTPGSWSLPIAQARACAAVYPLRALSFWQQAVERGGWRSGELLGRALQETAKVPGAKAAWASYVEAHPQLALAYARSLPADEGRAFFETWWRERGSNPAVTPAEAEIRSFYQVAPKWATREQFEEWIRRHAARVETDFRPWAAVLHAWGEDEHAWRLLSKRIPEPPWPTTRSLLSREQMEMRWKRQPENMMNAQALATFYFRSGELDAARNVIVTTASRPGAPAWFIRKGAYQLRGEGKAEEAVGVMLREK
jgi:hypothetical protein